MDKLFENYSLKNHNTFGIDVNARYYYEFSAAEEIVYFLKENPVSGIKKLILGSGSNIVFTQDFEGIVIHPKIRGVQIVEETTEYVLLKIGAGEVWDNFVNYCCKKNYGGVENLSLIPGMVGASPVQNIGAYGVEAKDVIEEVEAVNIETQKIEKFKNKDCKFEYRNSVFKNELKGKYIVTYVTYKLSKKPVLNTSYGKIQEELKNCKNINITSIRDAIINIRNRKLPDPEKIGNAGSFFKNPIVDSKKTQELKKDFPNIVSYKISETKDKIAAGWLIEQCGLKGKNFGKVGTYKDQALVIVNYGDATGKDVFNLAKDIQQKVYDKFGLALNMEVNIV
ncbi:MAG: UDP-N-acetylenolpyruvoylglucosamine reductase [Bacteroidetes bacterium]|nr:MAG: UDP-N-acetylenolpyruvoylglucosamine reductase [Bacteroidota bacterium]